MVLIQWWRSGFHIFSLDPGRRELRLVELVELRQKALHHLEYCFHHVPSMSRIFNDAEILGPHLKTQTTRYRSPDLLQGIYPSVASVLLRKSK